MEKKVKSKNYFIKYFRVTSILVLLSVVLLSFAYATPSVTSTIENIMAKVRPRGNAVITNTVQYSTTNGGSTSSINYNVHNVYGTISLPNSDSTITLKVDVTVMLSSEMKIAGISGLDSNLEYEFSNYTIGDVLCNTNNECNYGATDELYMTIKYKDNGYNSSNTSYAINMDFDFQIVEYVARIGTTRYNTLDAAVSSVPTNDTETTVVLLKNTSEVISVSNHQVINFDFQSYTLSNSGGNPVITNDGIIKISNGTISSNASQGAINNNSHGKIYMSGGRILATGSKQAIYNGGYVELSGSAYLSATSNQRAPLHNLANSTAVILGGTITSTRFYAIENLGSLTIGEKDGSVDKTTPLIKGETYGVNTTLGFNFYDGAIEGKTDAVNDETLISDIETSTEIIHTVDGSYKKIILGVKVNITFDPNGGNVSELSRQIDKGDVIGPLPTPIWANHNFDGWFTLGGTQVTENTTINEDTDLIAHWTEVLYAATINDTGYATLQAAINDVPTNNTKVVVKMLKNISDENILVAANKNIEFDFQNYTLSTTSGIVIDNRGTIEINNGHIIRNGTNDGNRVIVNRSSGTINISGGEIKSNPHQAIQNYGTVNITGGKIWLSTSADQGAINNENNSRMTISGGQILGTLRQAVYNDGGTLTITGNASLSNGNGVSTNRACVQNVRGTVTISGGTISSPATAYPAVLNNSTMTITGGTITSTQFNGINNGGTLVIGVKDGNISTSSVTVVGRKIGVNNTNSFKFYDGTIKGVDSSINGTIAEIETNSTRVDGTEVIDGLTYNTTHLE